MIEWLTDMLNSPVLIEVTDFLNCPQLVIGMLFGLLEGYVIFSR